MVITKVNSCHTAFLVLFIFFSIFFCSDPPAGATGELAEKLTLRLYKSTNIESWRETAAISFSWIGTGERHYLWDKSRKLVEVRWDDLVVQYAQRQPYQGIVFVKKKQVKELKKVKEYINKALKYFVNDAFWLNPVFHIDSPGAQKYSVSHNELLIHFSRGGVTPGDSYLFKLSKNGLVKEMKMWVSILPIKGMSVQFLNYITSKTGVTLALDHKLLFFNIKIKNMVMYDEYPLESSGDTFNASLLTF